MSIDSQDSIIACVKAGRSFIPTRIELILDPVFHYLPQVLDRIHIWWLWKPYHLVYFVFFPPICCDFSSMDRSAILRQHRILHLVLQISIIYSSIEKWTYCGSWIFHFLLFYLCRQVGESCRWEGGRSSLSIASNNLRFMLLFRIFFSFNVSLIMSAVLIVNV